MPRAHPSPPERLAIVKLGAIGDAVNSLPLVNRLRDGWPDTRITWVIGPLAHGLLAGHPSVDDFVVLDSKRAGDWPRAIRALRASRPDVVLDLQRILKSGALTRLSGAPRRVGFDRARSKESSWLFTNDRIPANPSPGVTVAQYLEFADHLGVAARAPRWDLPRDAWTEPRRSAGPLVVLNLGASKEANLWYADAWARVADELVRALDAEVVLSGGPQDRAVADEVARLAEVAVDDRVGALTLRESAGLFAAADLFVGGDTGPLHMAVAVGARVVALFGAADPARTGPFGQPAGVVTNPTDCSPCRKRYCFVDGHPCMRGLTADQVVRAARAALER